MAVVLGNEAVKKLLITVATPEIISVVEPFTQNHAEYAKSNGYEYRIDGLIWTHLHPSFSKVPAMERGLKEGWDWIVYADADVAFTNMRIDLKDIIESRLVEMPDLFEAGKQQLNWNAWKYICNGLLVIRNTPYAHKFFEMWTDYCLNGTPNVVPEQRIYITEHPFEQYSHDQLIRDTQYHGIYAATGKEIGCFSEFIWTDGEQWKPGYPSVHLAGPASLERKAEVFRTKYAHLVH